MGERWTHASREAPAIAGVLPEVLNLTTSSDASRLPPWTQTVRSTRCVLVASTCLTQNRQRRPVDGVGNSLDGVAVLICRLFASNVKSIVLVS